MKAITVTIIAILLLAAMPVQSQQQRTWEELWEEMQAGADDDEDD